ncbi:hypothetical protein CTM_18575 [Clostridium tetanomorphum DSM 665]|nr:hypothetical protein CTM_18575 [Clostridium tetanomorphum DSM 665]
MIKKGTWVEVEEIVLAPEDRAKNIPEETRKTPLKCWIRGNCLDDCDIGSEVQNILVVGRMLLKFLKIKSQMYYHSFGKYVKEIEYIGREARALIKK